MLVLSRYRDEVICIDDDIRITVVDIRGGGVRIGIEAPTDVAVHRKEVYDRIKNANNPVTKTVGSTNSMTKTRHIVAPKIAARKEVVSMT
jgi:carbon storage regulator